MKPIEELGRKEMLSGIEERPNVELYASNGDGGEEILEETHIGESLAAPFWDPLALEVLWSLDDGVDVKILLIAWDFHNV